jgi:type I restriction enzyme S subunit
MNPERLLQHFERISEAPDAIPRLRQFILDLAVRGKLVEQDPDDEPAAELLKRIQAEKERLVKEGKVKKKKPLQSRANGSMPTQLPKGWLWGCIQEVFPSVTDGDHIPPPKSESGIPFLVIGDVRSQSINFGGCRYVPDAYYQQLDEIRRPTKGDILYTLVGSYGIPVVVRDDRPFCVQRHIGILRPSRYVNVDCLARVLESRVVFDQATRCATGIAQKTVPLAGLRAILIPLPPLTEQHRIVAKVDELMALCGQLEAAKTEREQSRDRLVAASLHRLNSPADMAETNAPDLPARQADAFRDHARFVFNHLPRLTTRPEHIKQLRQTILNLAVRGKLVPQDPNDEPASELLKRIQAEKAQHIKDGKVKREAQLPLIDDTEVPFDLPQGWTWARFLELGTFGRGKSKHRPRNDPALFEGGTHLFVQTGDVARSKGVIETFTGKYNEVGLAQSATWPKGTLCITIAANIADSGILSFDACFPDSVVGFIPASIFPNARYFEYFIRTAKADLLEFAPATAQKNINLEILNAVLLPLPPSPNNTSSSPGWTN